ncbi:hypothetical protein K505DRAFT_343073 [Melanomma pulvis-pyrius CBS 109.77]|uniref:Uncharacterized protein n=1 Tax=Melanomma pulvis-pyrius CBS 109.77 TaxID=1314802 RepID=A0A6A6WT90_9PLEO|nr:hypothetical protein K505DRAFT_343073 [Melanomma pulvis-pyrius CBS 109.77]
MSSVTTVEWRRVPQISETSTFYAAKTQQLLYIYYYHPTQTSPGPNTMERRDEDAAAGARAVAEIMAHHALMVRWLQITEPFVKPIFHLFATLRLLFNLSLLSIPMMWLSCIIVSMLLWPNIPPYLPDLPIEHLEAVVRAAAWILWAVLLPFAHYRYFGWIVPTAL